MITSNDALERVLARLSADEIVSALGLATSPKPVQAVVRAAFCAMSTPLGRVLARFDARIDALGIARAAAAALEDLGATWRSDGDAPPASGPLLVVSNHPGAYDTLTLLAALGRDDAAIVAADRVFLRAMPTFGRHLFFVADATSAPTLKRSHGLRQALRHLARGGALVHFGAGRIEPDPAFVRARDVPAQDLLGHWLPGTGALLRATAGAGGALSAAVVEGVHSPKAKRLWAMRLAERRGVTTLVPLLQIGLKRYHDVDATVHFGAAVDARELAQGGDDAVIAAKVRDRALALLRPRG